ncbi:MAG: 4Fe-4S binding protein, partial [Candidatus Desantisbacteria bacterium]
PAILRDPNKCIRCGRCVRICLEIKGIGALGFVNRGFETTIEPTFGKPLSATGCDSCGKCAASCPTGALVDSSEHL